MNPEQPTTNRHDVVVFVRRGLVNGADIKQAALLAGRDHVPPAAHNVTVDITDVSDIKTDDGVDGRDYTVTIAWTPRTAASPLEPKGSIEDVEASLQPLTPQLIAEVGEPHES